MALVDELIATLSPGIEIPANLDKDLVFRGLMAIQEPQDFSSEFYRKQDCYLQEKLRAKGVVKLEDLSPFSNNLYLWQGDITRLQVDGIVNAANSQMLGCFVPNHACIDNAIHSQAGLQLRNECHELMQKQGHLEAIGQAKITSAYNLPSKFVLHTVGPVIQDHTSLVQMRELASCYQSCLELAVKKGMTSLAFCCISTGEFHFPNELAAQIAVQTVKEFCQEHSDLKIVFNVFKDIDLEIYSRLL
ncbi:protein-ADP-ribose hydrolase [Streptococcus orisasini]|uniref:protein-ADP-ribose hydrolase n=1 Tax=Streptococcus orisasini TaxID=1080071 RepID=UPI00070DBC97|nr:protein-ADP-ribose hydrolase [Streptococcus orisasini]